MTKALQTTPRHGAGEICSLNIEDLDVVELEHRLEMALALATGGFCGINHTCDCSSLSSCGTFCN